MHTMSVCLLRRAGTLFYRLQLDGRTVEREAPKDARGFLVIRAPDHDAARILSNAIDVLLAEKERVAPDAKGVRICGE